jgi:hypothetical protein
MHVHSLSVWRTSELSTALDPTSTIGVRRGASVIHVLLSKEPILFAISSYSYVA